MKKSYIAIIGLDADKKKRAAKFDAKDHEALDRAARSLGLVLAEPKTAEAVKAISKLPNGKLSGDGKAVVPIFKGKSDPFLDNFFPMLDSPDAPVPPPIYLWPDLIKGSIVVAPEVDPSEFGWWRAEIIGISSDKTKVTVKWLDNPRQAPTTMPREALAILHPKFQ